MRQQPRTLHARRSLISKAVRRCATASRLTAGVTIFSEKIFQRGDVEQGVGEKTLQARVLILQRLQPLGFRHFHAAELGLPLVNARVAHAMFAAQLGDWPPDSCSFEIAMICSSLKRLRFILWSSAWARVYFKTDKPQGATSSDSPLIVALEEATVRPQGAEPSVPETCFVEARQRRTIVLFDLRFCS